MKWHRHTTGYFVHHKQQTKMANDDIAFHSAILMTFNIVVDIHLPYFAVCSWSDAFQITKCIEDRLKPIEHLYNYIYNCSCASLCRYICICTYLLSFRFLADFRLPEKVNNHRYKCLLQNVHPLNIYIYLHINCWHNVDTILPGRESSAFATQRCHSRVTLHIFTCCHRCCRYRSRRLRQATLLIKLQRYCCAHLTLCWDGFAKRANGCVRGGIQTNPGHSTNSNPIGDPANTYTYTHRCGQTVSVYFIWWPRTFQMIG